MAKNVMFTSAMHSFQNLVVILVHCVLKVAEVFPKFENN